MDLENKRSVERQVEIGANLLGVATLVMGSAFATALLLSVIKFSYDQWNNRRTRALRATASLRRQRLQMAVRAKLAEIEDQETLADMHSLKWYLARRQPLVRFTGVGDITPDTSTNASITVLYSPGEKGDLDLNNLKTAEANLHELSEGTRGFMAQPQQSNPEQHLGMKNIAHQNKNGRSPVSSAARTTFNSTCVDSGSDVLESELDSSFQVSASLATSPPSSAVDNPD